MLIGVAGASGYVGSRLVPHLLASGHDVVAMSRSGGGRGAIDAARAHDEGDGGVGRAGRLRTVAVDIGDRRATADALAGVDVAFYLVHSMAGGSDFEERDRELAQAFASAAADAGVRRVVYLGGLGDGHSDAHAHPDADADPGDPGRSDLGRSGGEELSSHLASRHEVGAVLAAGPVPVVELRAAVILGSGSISFEMLRYLTERLPVMVCPRWIRTRIQPLAEADLLAHLERALSDDVAPGVYEVGGPEVTTYREMIAAYARVRGLRQRRIVDVPLLTPRLSARWVDLVTPVDPTVSHALIESLVTEVVVTHGERTAQAFGIETMGVDAALARALDDQAAELPDRLFDLPTGTSEGTYAMAEHASLAARDQPLVREGLWACGGDLSWYGLPWAWRLRMALGRLFGERLSLHRPAEVVPGATVDWWTVARADASTLVLATDRWFCGEAWLGYRLEPAGLPAAEASAADPADEPDGPPPAEARLVQVGALRTKGLLGVVYWRVLWPVHLVVFELMAKRQAKVKKAAATS